MARPFWHRLVALGIRLACLALAGLVTLALLPHLVGDPVETYRSEHGLSPRAVKMLARFEAIWSDDTLREQTLSAIRAQNPEWDFMARTYYVLALANAALREPERTERHLELMDRVIQSTLEAETRHGHEHFLMGYGRHGGWIQQPPRSLFVDSEIALMCAARRFVREHDPWKAELSRRVDIMVQRMNAAPMQSAESYPDECWAFCNTVALAAIHMHDVLDGTDHREFIRRWIDNARLGLTHQPTGLLISAYHIDGTPGHSGPGPEGSSIWMVAHMLQLVDPDYARRQYDGAVKHLGGSLMGFGYAREYPAITGGTPDVDSGPLVPGLDASPGSSGLAVMAAAAFDDTDYFKALCRSLELVAVPHEDDKGRLSYKASNLVGDAVLMYAMTVGPLWDVIEHRAVEGAPTSPLSPSRYGHWGYWLATVAGFVVGPLIVLYFFFAILACRAPGTRRFFPRRRKKTDASEPGSGASDGESSG